MFFLPFVSLKLLATIEATLKIFRSGECFQFFTNEPTKEIFAAEVVL